MDPALIGVIGTGAGAIVGYLGVLTTAILTRKREDRARDYIEKRNVYSEVIVVLDRRVNHISSLMRRKKELSYEDTYKEQLDTERLSLGSLILIGPVEVRGKAAAIDRELEAWIRDHENEDKHEEHHKAALRKMAELQMAMRKDLGRNE